MVALDELLKRLETRDAKLQGEVAKGVFAYGSHRPMGRIRSYASAGLAPFAQRGAQSEFHLLGHVHLTDEGHVSLVEGFNGGEGERWARQAFETLRKSDALTPDAGLQPLAPLRGCVHTGIR